MLVAIRLDFELLPVVRISFVYTQVDSPAANKKATIELDI